MSSFEDKVWLDFNRRLDAVCRDTLEATAKRENALILAHFKTTLDAVEDRLNAGSIEYKSYSAFDFSSLCLRHPNETPSVWVGQASHFKARSVPPSEHSSSSYNLWIVHIQPTKSRRAPGKP
jgi:hypothetical protein